jgi:hypothetical protein
VLRGLASKHPWLRGLDLNQRPSGYEPDELPDCSTPRKHLSGTGAGRQTAAYERRYFYQELYAPPPFGEESSDFEWTSVTPVPVWSGLSATSSNVNCQSLLRVTGSVGTSRR